MRAYVGLQFDNYESNFSLSSIGKNETSYFEKKATLLDKTNRIKVEISFVGQNNKKYSVSYAIPTREKWDKKTIVNSDITQLDYQEL